ncbi:MAG: cytochrome c3 family protein [Thermoanaerobaculia bacterium]
MTDSTRTELLDRLRAGIVLLVVLAASFALAATASAKPPTDDDCLACHSEPVGKGKKAPQKALAASVHGEAGLSCVDCHSDLATLKTLPHGSKVAPADCTSCHDSVAESHAFHPMMKDDPTAIACADCHGAHDVVRAADPGSPVAPATVGKVCATCHETEVDLYTKSAHGVAATAKVKEAPACLTCHKTALVSVPDGAPPASAKQAQEKVCLSCHLDSPEVRTRVSPSAGFIAKYEESVHGKALLAGNEKAANCVDCHGAHTVRKKSADGTGPTPLDIEKTCARCHIEVDAAFSKSAHGQALARGVREAPTCTTCHGEHNILKAQDPSSPVAAANVAQKVCTPCHSSLRLSEKYDIKSDAFKTFEESFHGLAVKGGQANVANCASCHGSHDILPSSDPASRIHKDKLVATCGECHPGAGARFAQGKIHVDATSKDEEPLLWWIGFIYAGLIVGTIGGMAAHNLLDFVKKSRHQHHIRHGLVEVEPAPHRLYLRMTLEERLQHAALALSFIVLVITGFMLRFPDSWWVVALRNLSTSAFEARSWIHRIAAIVMCLASAYHLYYVIFTARGRQLVKDLWFRLKDARDLFDMLKYNLGMTPVKPKLDRFSYIEKAEYWALIWGTIVMAGTGFAMWLDNSFMNLFGKLGYDVARSVHYYEAILATLAIIVWHFYFVMFNPESYPLNTAFWTGHLSHREMEEEHPLELERILEAEETERASAEMAASRAKTEGEEEPKA